MTPVMFATVDRLHDVVRAKQPKRLPIVLTRDELRAVITELHGTLRLMATLLYGSGLRLLECCRPRVHMPHRTRSTPGLPPPT